MPSPTLHSPLGASSMHRWERCPGSIALCEGIPNTSSKFAELGTAAHSLGEMCLPKQTATGKWPGELKLKNPHSFVGKEIEVENDIEGVENNFYTVDANMAVAVDVYLDAIFDCWHKYDCDYLFVEHKFHITEIDDRLFGTNDTGLYSSTTRTLIVLDYKHGEHTYVEVEDNSQLQYYGLGAVYELNKMGLTVDKVIICVVQPRCPATCTVRYQELTIFDIHDFSVRLRDAVEEVDHDPTLETGDHCGWCPAKGICPQQLKDAFPLISAALTNEKPKPEALTPEQISSVLRASSATESYIKAVKEYAKEFVKGGGAIPDYSMGAGNKSHVWSDVTAMENYCTDHGIEYETVPAIMGPSALLKTVTGDDKIELEKLATTMPGAPKLMQSKNIKQPTKEEIQDIFK